MTIMNEYHLFLLAVPLLFLDWQIALVWVIGVSQPLISSEMLLLDFEGFEIFIIFLAIASTRRFLFRSS